jgi:D-xylose transport system permease protein
VSDADVVGVQGPVAGPGEADADEPAGWWQSVRDNIRSGNLGVLPVVLGEIAIVAFFAFTATNFFTAQNFVNVILQMAGVTMIAYGVVFVLLLGEIDLSIGYVSGIAALTAAELQLASSNHDYPGYVAILAALGVVAVIGIAQGAFVALVGVPSFVVTLAGLLIWQGVILKVLELRGVIIIEDDWINKTATHYFSATTSWIIAIVITGAYALGALGGAIGQRRAGLAIRPWYALAKVAGVAVACFGTVAICTHATRPTACPEGTPLTETCTRPLGLPLAGLLMVIFLVGLTYLAKRTTFGRHVYAVGGNAEAARRAGINVPRVRILVFMISGIMAGVGGIILSARLQSVNLNVGGGTLLLDSISAAVIGGVSLFGGRGEVRGALLGSLVIATIANGLNIGGYSTGTIYTVTGVILLLAVTLDTIARRLQVKAGR